MKIWGREIAIAQISTHFFSGRRLSTVEEQVPTVFEEVEGVEHLAVISLPVGQA